MPKPRDLSHHVGQSFNEWTVIQLGDGVGIKDRKALCRCSCGTEAWLHFNNVIRGLSTKCKGHDRPGFRLPSVPAATLPERHVWHGIKTRCFNKREKGYKRYGGRGITVCDRWLGADGFLNFLADMGRRPSDRHTIERVDNHGPYSPDNCVWATCLEQANNTRANTVWTYQDQSKTVAEWSRFLGMSPSTLLHRVTVLGWSIEDALTRPVRLTSRRFSPRDS